MAMAQGQRNCGPWADYAALERVRLALCNVDLFALVLRAQKQIYSVLSAVVASVRIRVVSLELKYGGSGARSLLRAQNNSIDDEGIATLQSPAAWNTSPHP
jgi:hypothetical protein